MSDVLSGTVMWQSKDGQLTLTKARVGSLTYAPSGAAAVPTTGWS